MIQVINLSAHFIVIALLYGPWTMSGVNGFINIDIEQEPMKRWKGPISTGALLLNPAPLISTLTSLAEADNCLGGDRQAGGRGRSKGATLQMEQITLSQYGSGGCMWLYFPTVPANIGGKVDFQQTLLFPRTSRPHSHSCYWNCCF